MEEEWKEDKGKRKKRVRKRSRARAPSLRESARRRIIPCKWIMSRRCSLPTQSRIVVLAYRLPALSSFSFLLSPFSLISILLPCLSFRVVNRSRWLNALWLFGL